MEDQVTAGLTKAIGLSNFNASQITRIMEKATILPSNLQIEIHADYAQKDMVEFCKKHDIVVTAYAPLGSPSSDKYILYNSIYFLINFENKYILVPIFRLY